MNPAQSRNSSGTQRSLPWKAISFALMALGWVISGYLLLRVFRLGGSAGPPIGDVCSAVFGAGCDATLLSPTSWQLGFPLAGWGLVYFAAIGLLLALGDRTSLLTAFLTAAAGNGAGLAMIAAIVTGWSPFCPLCLLAHAVNLALLAALWVGAAQVAVQKKPKQRPSRFSAGRWLGPALAVGILVQAGFFWKDVQSEAGDLGKLLQAYQQQPPMDVPVGAEDPVLGPRDAKIRIVVLSSFQCPGCAAFSRSAHHLRERFGDRVALVYKHFPLESECNPMLPGDPQPRSCDAAWAAEAARRQGRFWAYHDLLFSSDLAATEEQLDAMALEAGLDLERWRADRGSAEVRDKVRSDAELGIRLKIEVTPTVFVNGRRIPNLSPAAWEALIAALLAAD